MRFAVPVSCVRSADRMFFIAFLIFQKYITFGFFYYTPKWNSAVKFLYHYQIQVRALYQICYLKTNLCFMSTLLHFYAVLENPFT